MHKTLTLMLLGASWAVLAGCEQSDTVGEPAEGLPQNEAPSTEPDVQIGRSDSVEPGEPAEPAAPQRQPAPAGQEPAGAQPDAGGANEPPPN
ncbi:MAG: hypothetical protein JXB36_18530 [Gammaproteobacteria bacterium]|nr:hypothetical protein [Gammaproteobacteria bacterium]